MKKYIPIASFAIILLSSSIDSVALCTHTPFYNGKSTITINFPFKKNNYVYKDYLDFSIDDPNIVLSEWQTNQPAVQKYDPHFKEYKKIFTKPLTITLDMHHTSTNYPTDTAYLHMTYYSTAKNSLQRKVFPLNYTKQSISAVQTPINTNIDVTASLPLVNNTTSFSPSSISKTLSSYHGLLHRALQTIQQKQSLLIRSLLTCVLGFFLSFTPCVYPMIPITAGILQAYGSTSIPYNFLLSACYTIGLSTTFACLGLFATYTGKLFGSVGHHPLFIIGFVLLLLYLAGSMLGLYTLYLPGYKPAHRFYAKKSLASAFLYGVASGTIASPCISPGLIAILGLVATMNSTLAGFVLLFAFGIGLSIPLLLVGSCSSSLALLPAAGAWMIEIKRLCAFLLIGTSFYLLKPFIALPILLLLVACSCVCIGVMYFSMKSDSHSIRLNVIKSIVGFCFLASFPVMFFKAYQATQFHENPALAWHTDYYVALAQAQKENKKLLIDVTAPYCSLCNAIDNKLLCDTRVLSHFKHYITVRIDGSTHNTCCTYLQQKYAILGFPTILLVDPHTEQVLKRWSSELYEKQPKDFIAEIQHIV